MLQSMSEVNGELIHEVIRLEDLEDEKAKERIKGEIFLLSYFIQNLLHIQEEKTKKYLSQ